MVLEYYDSFYHLSDTEMINYTFRSLLTEYIKTKDFKIRFTKGVKHNDTHKLSIYILASKWKFLKHILTLKCDAISEKESVIKCVNIEKPLLSRLNKNKELNDFANEFNDFLIGQHLYFTK